MCKSSSKMYGYKGLNVTKVQSSTQLHEAHYVRTRCAVGPARVGRKPETTTWFERDVSRITDDYFFIIVFIEQ